MKKILSVIFIFSFLTGCGGNKTKVSPFTKGISFVSEVMYYNEMYECECDFQTNGDAEIKFKYPSEMENLTFLFTEKGTSAKFDDIEYINEKSVFENSAASFIYEVLSNTDSEVYKENDIFYTAGATDDFEWRLELGATGLPIKITTRSDAVEVVFKNVTIK